MKVKELLKMLGDGLYCTFDIIWNFEENGDTTEKKEHSVQTDDMVAIEELFGEWTVANEDSLFVTPKENETVLVTLYVYKPKMKVMSTTSSFIEEEEIICPQCGAEHDPEDDIEDAKHQCFYCGYEWDKAKNEGEE